MKEKYVDAKKYICYLKMLFIDKQCIKVLTVLISQKPNKNET